MSDSKHYVHNNQALKSNKTIVTIIACFIFVLAVFSYTIIYRIDHVTAMDSSEYHKARDKYLNSETYN